MTAHEGRLVVGRDTAMVDLRELAEEHRVLVIVGAPGVGKSHIGRALAKELGYHELARGGDMDAGHRFVDGVTLVTELRREIARDQTRWILTAGGPLNLPEKRSFVLHRLVRAEARVLFMDRAGLRETALDESDLGTLEAIVERLDGIPLALELAAKRLGVRTLDSLLDDLGDPAALLIDPTYPTRSFEASVERWIEQRSADERDALQAMSVFRGPWTRSDLQAVADFGSVLEVLVREGLVLRESGHDGPPRFRLLRPFLACLRSKRPPAERLRARHAEHMARLVRDGRPLEGKGRDLDAAFSWAVEERPALAVPILSGIDRIASEEGPLTSLPAQADALLSRLDPGAHSDRAEVMEIRAYAFRSMGRLCDATRGYAEMVALAEGVGDARTLARGHGGLGAVALLEDRLDDAERHHSSALAIYRELGEPTLQARTLGNQALTCIGRGRPTEAVALLAEALAIFEEVGEDLAAAVTEANLGAARGYAGQLVPARRDLTRALDRLERLGAVRGAAMAQWKLGRPPRAAAARRPPTRAAFRVPRALGRGGRGPAALARGHSP